MVPSLRNYIWLGFYSFFVYQQNKFLFMAKVFTGNSINYREMHFYEIDLNWIKIDFEKGKIKKCSCNTNSVITYIHNSPI